MTTLKVLVTSSAVVLLATLTLVAPSALMPELIKRVRVAKPMLLAVLASNTSRSRGEGEGVLYPRRNRATAQHSPP